jgi:hypothetical protein
VGGAVVDRVTRRLNGDSALTIPMSFVPSALGPVVIRVSASVDGADSPALADAAVDVVDATRAVLFYDPRPSWMSTFVRRTVERDPRFTVSSRTLTSRGVGADAGRPPSTLQDWARLASFDAVVIGAPQLLSAADVAGVEAFMRRRGGSVIFLLDDAAPGPYERLTRASGWSSSRGTPAAFSLAGSDSASIRASEIVAPAALPFASTPLAGSGQPVVWETPRRRRPAHRERRGGRVAFSRSVCLLVRSLLAHGDCRRGDVGATAADRRTGRRRRVAR